MKKLLCCLLVLVLLSGCGKEDSAVNLPSFPDVEDIDLGIERIEGEVVSIVDQYIEVLTTVEDKQVNVQILNVDNKNELEIGDNVHINLDDRHLIQGPESIYGYAANVEVINEEIYHHTLVDYNDIQYYYTGVIEGEIMKCGMMDGMVKDETGNSYYYQAGPFVETISVVMEDQTKIYATKKGAHELALYKANFNWLIVDDLSLLADLDEWVDVDEDWPSDKKMYWTKRRKDAQIFNDGIYFPVRSNQVDEATYEYYFHDYILVMDMPLPDGIYVVNTNDGGCGIYGASALMGINGYLSFKPMAKSELANWEKVDDHFELKQGNYTEIVYDFGSINEKFEMIGYNLSESSIDDHDAKVLADNELKEWSDAKKHISFKGVQREE